MHGMHIRACNTGLHLQIGLLMKSFLLQALFIPQPNLEGDLRLQMYTVFIKFASLHFFFKASEGIH